MDTDSFWFIINTNNVIKDLKNVREIFDSSNLNKNPCLYNMKNKRVKGQFNIETPGNVFIDGFICLGSKAFSFKCRSDNKKN